MPKPRPAYFLRHEINVQLTDDSIRILNGMQTNGWGVFGVYKEDFKPGGIYQVVGLTFEIFEDNSRELCYMVYTRDNILTVKSTKLFKKV